jgi:RNA polymerase sigma factor (sigma-70 family)
MMSVSTDCELVAAYAARGSENAFRALVTRHVNLVYATALRQVGDTALAEEITQNVFIALARKAPRLAGIQTLAGWLHRTAIFEAKARVRAELRRGRREEMAAEAAALQREGTSPLEALVPLLDEGLLNLRDGDRLALVLRFFEERSLRDVGAALGVDEDAARKRVSRALERLAGFFRQRGFAVPAGASAAALLANTVIAVPTGLAASATSAGLAAGGAAVGIHLVWFKLMALTKTETAVLCAIVAAAPLAWQWQASARAARDQADLSAELAAGQRVEIGLEAQVQRLHEALRRAQTDGSKSVARLAALNVQREAQAPRPVYRWDDNSPLLRVPKKFLDQVQIEATVNRRGRLNDQIKEVLQLTDAEAQEGQSAIDRFLSDYHAAQAQKMRRVEPTEKDLSEHKPEETRVFEIADVSEPLGQFRETLFGELEAALGSERFKLFRNGLQDWMPIDDEDHGMNSGMAVYDFGYRLRFYQPKPGDRSLTWGLSASEPRHGAMGGPIALDDIPELFRAHLQDWIALALSRPPKEDNAQK